jgi:hypothetical protein
MRSQLEERNSKTARSTNHTFVIAGERHLLALGAQKFDLMRDATRSAPVAAAAKAQVRGPRPQMGVPAQLNRPKSNSAGIFKRDDV